MFRRLQHLPCEEKLREKGLLSLEKRQLQGKMIQVFNTDKTTEKIQSGCILKCSVGGWHTAVTSYTGEVPSAYKKKKFCMGAVKNRKRLPREVMAGGKTTPSLEVFKSQLYRPAQEVGIETTQASFQHECSVIL